MTPDDIPKLQRALQQVFPSDVITVDVRPGGRLTIGAQRQDDACLVVLSPDTMDYTALDWTEWLHRATTALNAKRLAR